MFRIEIDIADWDFSAERVIIETKDFDKIAIIQEFIEFQQNHAWCVDYDVTDEYEFNQCDEDEEDADESDEDEEDGEYEIGETVEDDDGLVWERVA